MENIIQLHLPLTRETTTTSSKPIQDLHRLENMNAEFSLTLKQEPFPTPQPTKTQTQLQPRRTSSLANYKDMDNICRLLNYDPTTAMKSFIDEKPTFRYYETQNHGVMKNSISSSVSSSSSFDDGDESPFGRWESFDYDTDGYQTDEDNRSLCDEVLNQLFSDQAELSIIGMNF